MFVGNVNEVIKHRYLQREHKKKLLEIVVHRSRDAAKIEDHQNLQYMLNKTQQIKTNYKLKTEKEYILKENKRVLKNLLKICDNDKELKHNNKFPQSRAVTYDEIKNKIISSKMRDRRNTMNEINNENISLSRKLVTTQSKVSKAHFEKLWSDKKSFNANVCRFDQTGGLKINRQATKILSTTQNSPRTIYDKIGYNEEPIEIRFSSIPPLRTQKIKMRTTRNFTRKKIKEANDYVSTWKNQNSTTGFDSNRINPNNRSDIVPKSRYAHPYDKYSVHSFMPGRERNVFENPDSEDCNKSLETAVFKNHSNIYDLDPNNQGSTKNHKGLSNRQSPLKHKNSTSGHAILRTEAAHINTDSDAINDKRANTANNSQQKEEENQQEDYIDKITIDKQDIDIKQQSPKGKDNSNIDTEMKITDYKNAEGSVQLRGSTNQKLNEMDITVE